MAQREKHWWTPWTVFGAGVVLTMLLLASVGGEVFYNGDAGVKALLTKQWADGMCTLDLRLHAPPWTRALWEDGLYPFQPPFVYERADRHYLAFPFLFPVLSSPLYRLAGFRGLYLIPAVSLWIVWLMVDHVGRRQATTAKTRAWRLAVLVFSSPLTVYGAMFSEHTLAVALAVGGLCVISGGTGGAPKTGRMVFGSALLGLSAWLRPEMVALIVGSAVPFVYLQTRRHDTRLPFFMVGVLGPLAALLAANIWLSGHPLGFHAVQVTHGFLSVRHLDLGLSMLAKLPFLFVCFFPPALAMAAHLITTSRGHRLSPIQAWRLVGTGVGVIVLLCMIPNDGGKQWGPRYLLVLMPLLVIWGRGNHVWHEQGAPFGRQRALRVGSILCFAAGVAINTVGGTVNLVRDYQSRVLPALRYLERESAEVLAFPQQYVAQELEALLDSRAVVLTDGVADLKRLARTLGTQGISRFTYVCMTNRVMPGAIPLMTTQGPALIIAGPPQRKGWFLIYQVVVRH